MIGLLQPDTRVLELDSNQIKITNNVYYLKTFERNYES